MGKTPYNNGGKEDAFNAEGAEDKESDGQASQRQGDYDDDAFKPEVQHNTRAARAQAQRSPDHAAQEHNERQQVLPPWGQQCATTTPSTGDTAYSGLANMLAWGGPRLTDKNKISSELNWQPTSAKDKEKIKKIPKNVLQVRGFHAFLFKTKDSCFVQMAHSVAKFATINPIAEDVGGKIFAFIGDRLSNQEPWAILIPTNVWTTWTTHKVGKDVKTMTEHYKDRRNYGGLYQEAGAKTIKHAPNILAIPLNTVRLFNLHKKGKMPHECLDLLMRHISNPNIVEDKDG